MNKKPLDYFEEIIYFPVREIDRWPFPKLVRFLLSFLACIPIIIMYIPLFLFFGIWETWLDYE